MIGWLVESSGNDAPPDRYDYACANYCADVDYTGVNLVLGFWKLKETLPFIIKGMPDELNYAAFCHDRDTGDYSSYDQVTAADAAYINAVKAYAMKQPEGQREIWLLYANNAMVAIRVWTLLRTSSFGW